MGRKYTEEELIEELKRVSEEHCDGGVPSKRIINKFGKSGHTTYQRYFGSWREAVEASGFIPRGVNGGIKKEYIIEEIQRISDEHCDGEAPTTEQFRKHSQHSEAGAVKHFGSWNNALREVGLNVNRENNASTEEEVLCAIESIPEESYSGNRPTASEAEDYLSVSITTLYNNFGGWSELLTEAGFPEEYKKYTREDMIEEIQQISSKKLDGRVPMGEDIEKYASFHRNTILDHFQNLRELRESAGFERYPYNSSAGHWRDKYGGIGRS